jgi:hypothetical protein
VVLGVGLLLSLIGTVGSALKNNKPSCAGCSSICVGCLICLISLAMWFRNAQNDVSVSETITTRIHAIDDHQYIIYQSRDNTQPTIINANIYFGKPIQNGAPVKVTIYNRWSKGILMLRSDKIELVPQRPVPPNILGDV